MESINANAASLLIQKNLTNALSEIANGQKGSGIKFNNVDDKGAYSVGQMLSGQTLGFDSIMDNVASFKDLFFTAQDTYAQMQIQAEDILALINKAHDEEQTEESLNIINSEIGLKIDNINKLYECSKFDGVSPFESPFGINIPNWQDIAKQFAEVQEPTEEEKSEFTNVLADISFDIDMSAFANGTSFSMQGSANIQIGFTDDGALQITVDASLDYDLSGITEKGAQSNDALELIKNFISLLSGRQDQFNAFNTFFDNLLMGNFGEFPGLSIEDGAENSSSSSELQGKIVQQATITLDGYPNQIPNIAINLL